MALYFDQVLYNSPTKYFTALSGLTDFWDTITSSTLTKGGVTMTLESSTTITVSGFDLALTNNITSSSGLAKTIIAYTDNGIVGFTMPSSGTQNCEWAIGRDDAGNWGAVVGKGPTPVISELIADGVSSTTFGGGTVTNSNENVQIVDVCADKGNFIFENIKRILQSPQTAYVGKMQMENGEKYVQCWALALKYTE